MFRTPSGLVAEVGQYDSNCYMKITLNFDDRLVQAATVRAAESGETLTRLIEIALRTHLDSLSSRRPDFRMQLLVRGGQPVLGVTLNDRDALYEHMENRE